MNRKKRLRADSACERICDIYIGLLFSAFLLLCSPYQGITAFKYQLFCWLTGTFLVVEVVLIIELLLVQQTMRDDLRQAIEGKRTVLMFAAAYLLLVCVSALFTPYEYDAWEGMSRNDGLLTRLLYIACFILLALFGRLKRWHLFLLGGTMVVFCGICTLQFAGGNPLSLYPEGCNYFDAYLKYAGEFLGTVGNAGLSAALLVMAFGAFYALLLTRQRRRDRIWSALPLIAVTLTLLKAQIAAGFVAMLGVLFVITPLALRVRCAWSIKRLFATEGFALLGVLLFVFFYDFGGSGTLYELHELLHLRIRDEFGSGRIKIWRQVLAEMPNHLLFGTGPDSMRAWGMDGFFRFVPDMGATVQLGIDAAHNEYLNIAAEEGILAFLTYAALLIVVFLRAFRTADRQSLVVFSAAFAYAVQALFGIAMCIVTPLFFTFLGLTVSHTTSNIMEGSEYA